MIPRDPDWEELRDAAAARLALVAYAAAMTALVMWLALVIGTAAALLVQTL